MFNFNRPYVRNENKFFTPIYLPGEDYSFYIHSDYAFDDIDITWFKLHIVDAGDVFAADMGLVQPLYYTGVGYVYDIYMNSFVFPQLPDGYYFFKIYNSLKLEYVLSSACILVSSDCMSWSTPVKFRHNDQLYGVRYDLATSFWQKFRLPIAQIKPPEFVSERDSYRESSNGRELRMSKSFRDIKLTLEMYWADDEDMQALSAVNEHSDVYIDGNKLILLSQIKTETPSVFSNQSKATFEVIVEDYNLDMNGEDYGEFMIFGGNIFNIVDIFITA